MSQKEASKTQKTYDMHLILNTHWDREYRWSFRETQMRLVEAGDILIDTMERDPRFTYFHPDSQASFLDDYLELRPERRDSVKKLVSEGRILAGPWYTLPSEYMVSAEALVRNLLMGHRIAGELGGVMKVAYNIFSWGQISQLPQIYRQFGMDTILFYRGIDQSKLDRLEFWWEAPDGSRALGLTFGSFHRLNFWIYVYNPYIKDGRKTGSTPSGSGYGLTSIQQGGGSLARLADDYSTEDMNYHVFYQPCHNNMEAAISGMKTLLDTVKDVSSTRHLLFLQGFDQENPDPVIPDLVEAINKEIDYGKVRISSLPEYVKCVREALAEEKIDSKLLTLTGEMLNVETSGDAFAPLYIGTYSARMPVKMQNADCQYRLERWAEPAAVWQYLRGQEYPETVLRIAWKEILQNQQHDGIGGCHIDRVQQAMEERNRCAYDIAEAVTRDALTALTADIDYSNLGEQELGVTVFNSIAQDRSEVIKVTVDVPREWGLRYRGNYKYPIMLDVMDAEGKAVPVQILSVEEEEVYGYLKFGNAISFPASRVTAAILADVPAMGYASYTARPRHAAHRPIETISLQPRVLENAYLRAEILSDGTVNLLDKETGRTYSGLNTFEDGGECGGPLTHYKPKDDTVYTTAGQPAQVAQVSAGPLSATYRIEREWMLPDGLEEDRKIHVPHGAEFIEYGAPTRASRKKAVKITTEVTLRKDSRFLEFTTVVDNAVTDHRLRVLFPTGLSEAKVVHVDSPFDVVERNIAIPDSTGWYESAARTLPTTSFVDVSDGKAGLAAFHYGLSEYEVVDDPTRTIALTMLRCFGTAGNPTETFVYQPLAQCQGEHTFRYAVMPHAGDWRTGEVLLQANVFTSPLRAVACTPHKGTLPQRHSFFSVDDKRFTITAVKKAEYEEAVVLRGYNPTPDALKVTLTVPSSVSKAAKVTLEEKVIEELPISGGKISVPVKAGEIASVMLWRKE